MTGKAQNSIEINRGVNHLYINRVRSGAYRFRKNLGRIAEIDKVKSLH